MLLFGARVHPLQYLVHPLPPETPAFICDGRVSKKNAGLVTRGKRTDGMRSFATDGCRKRTQVRGAGEAPVHRRSADGSAPLNIELGRDLGRRADVVQHAVAAAGAAGDA